MGHKKQSQYGPVHRLLGNMPTERDLSFVKVDDDIIDEAYAEVRTVYGKDIDGQTLEKDAYEVIARDMPALVRAVKEVAIVRSRAQGL